MSIEKRPPDVARDLFAPIAAGYERWARWLSMGQDGRWRRTMVAQLDLPSGSRVLDVAAGTGSITRALHARGFEVVSLDQSPEMLRPATERGAAGVLATAEHLPFPDEAFDGLTFGYLLRYVDDVEAAMRELARVVRPGGMVGMVEFGRPRGIWGPAWHLYTRIGLPVAGAVIRDGWDDVGRFLGPSIDSFARRFPPDVLSEVWRSAGLREVLARPMSLGGGLVMWGRR